MKTVILNGAATEGQNSRTDRVYAMLAAVIRTKNWPAVNFALAAMNIKPCRGCFSCWVKTPGRCVITDDDQEAILRAWADADLIALLTPITFGGFAPELKKAMDRIIPVLLPFFIKIRGETHHPQRYPRRRRLLVIGTQKQEDADSEGVFRRLVQRNALNMGNVEATTLVFSGDISLAGIEKKLDEEPLFREEAK